MPELVAINGEIFPPGEAKISVFDRGFLYGDGVYEVTRTYGKVLFALEDHVDRLYNSAARIHLKLKWSKQDLMKELYRIVDAAQQDDLYMRVVITRGAAKINLDPNSSTEPNIVVFVQNLPQIAPEMYTTGQVLITSTVQRNSKQALDPNIKSGNYLNNIMALEEAKRRRAHDAVMVNRDGYITEGTTWNMYMVKDGVYYSPPDSADMLLGITRKIVRQLARDHHFEWQERFTPADVKGADEAFTTSSLKEVMPVLSLDGIVIGPQIAGPQIENPQIPGPMTKQLAQAYRQFVEKYCREHWR